MRNSSAVVEKKSCNEYVGSHHPTRDQGKEPGQRNSISAREKTGPG